MCGYNGYVNSIETIAISGVNWDGNVPLYAEACAGIMAVTLSREGFGDVSKIVSIPRLPRSFINCNYHILFKVDLKRQPLTKRGRASIQRNSVYLKVFKTSKLRA